MKNIMRMFGSAGSNSETSTAKASAMQGHEHGHQHKERTPAKGYQCPMKCEGGKVYESPGNCPVCNMKLVPVGTEKSGGHHHHSCCH